MISLCNILECVGYLYVQRWYVDGTVECFVGEHAPLAISAISVLIFCVLLALLMLVIVIRNTKVCNKCIIR